MDDLNPAGNPTRAGSAREKRLGARQLMYAMFGLGLVLGYSQVVELGLDGLFGFGDAELSRVSSIARIAASALVFVWYAVLGILRHYTIRKMTIVGAGLLMTFSTALFAPFAGTSGEVAMSAFSGFASGFLTLVWMLVLTTLDRRDLVLVCTGALAVAAATTLGSRPIGPDACLALLSLIALTSPLALLAVDPGLVSCGPDFDATAPSQGTGVAPWLPVALFVGCGCAASLLWGACQASPAFNEPSAPVLGLVLLVLSATTLLAVLRLDWFGDVVWAPMFVAAVACLGFVGTSFSGVSPAVSGLVAGAYLSSVFLKWVVVPAVVSSLRTTRLFACSLFLLIAAGGLWSAFGVALAGAMPSIDRGAILASSSNAASLLLLVLMAVLFLASRVYGRSSHEVAGSEEAAGGSAAAVKEADDATSVPESPARAVAAAYSFQDKFESFAKAKGLTSREQEIALLTARGYSSTRIAEMLIISSSTVRFHQQNIYRKLEVHSRQDYIDLVGTSMESLG